MTLTASYANLEAAAVTRAREKSSTGGVWHDRLFARFRENPYPLTVFEDGVVPAASLWTGARQWIAAFRRAGLQSGDRVALALPPSPAFLQILIAGLWEELTLAFLAPEDNLEAMLETLDARCGIGFPSAEPIWNPDGNSGPVQETLTLRDTKGASTPEARFLLRTSGTTATPHWIALSDRNILANIEAHIPLLYQGDARVLSVLPWNHAFGLIIDLMTALFIGAEIVRDPSGGRDIEKITELLREGDTTHLSAVPLTISRLASTSEGERLLHGLQGGVVGGAPVSPDLADFLAHTRLRTGYGQTEASPGITLGEPGIWEAHYIGNPLGCLTQIDEEGQLLFAGENACLGFWQEGALHSLDPKRWVATGDIVREQENGLVFLGRLDDAFKLANGKRIQAGPIESCLKARFPAIREALLTSRDGETLTLCVGLAPGVECPPFPALLDCLGAIGGRLHLVRVMPEGMFVHTAKGGLNRKATIEALL